MKKLILSFAFALLVTSCANAKETKDKKFATKDEVRLTLGLLKNIKVTNYPIFCNGDYSLEPNDIKIVNEELKKIDYLKNLLIHVNIKSTQLKEVRRYIKKVSIEDENNRFLCIKKK